MNKIKSIDVPQANTLSTVENLLALVDARMAEKRNLSGQLGLAPREVDYYKHAARILGLCKFVNGRIRLTKKGREFINATRIADRRELMGAAVRQSKVFSELLSHYTEPELSVENIAQFLKNSTTLTGSTLWRRAQSMSAWLNTISDVDPEEYESIAVNASKKYEKILRNFKPLGEGKNHKELKHALADNPSLLGADLKLVRMEYQFPTGDRADLLYIDSRKRFLAVEVEVDVGALDIVGLLQAMKYKMMIMVQFGRSEIDVRGMLAARSIDSTMIRRADRYNIESKVIKGII